MDEANDGIQISVKILVAGSVSRTLWHVVGAKNTRNHKFSLV
jgi:hypothetical protein